MGIPFFSLFFYHDIIYNPLRKNNEETSAAFAVKVLKAIEYPTSLILECEEQIMATKAHREQTGIDMDFLTDADFSLLGMDWKNIPPIAGRCGMNTLSILTSSIPLDGSRCCSIFFQ
jgi:hypothetical protein